MTEEIKDQLEEFSQVSHIQCFLHIMNLVAKSLLRQFDAKKKTPADEDDETEREIEQLADGAEYEEEVARLVDEDEDDAEDDNDIILDINEIVPEGQRAQFHTDVRPMRLVLAKVSQTIICTMWPFSKLLSASQTILQGDKIHHYLAAVVEGMPCQSSAETVADSP
jgi:hypothetical protein